MDLAFGSALERQPGATTPGTAAKVRWLDDRLREHASTENPRFEMLVLTGFAAMALGLTLIGGVGVVLFMIATRPRGIGIRAAIGASSRSLVCMVPRQTILPVAAGLVLGLLTTPWAARLAEPQILKVQTSDPVMWILAATAVVVAALLAAYLPARGAARVDPIVVLRDEWLPSWPQAGGGSLAPVQPEQQVMHRGGCIEDEGSRQAL